MNKYVAGTEKERLVRLFLFHELLTRSIAEYAEHATDKIFIGNLRRSKTFLKKSLDQRLESLDKDAEINLIKSINKIGFAFLPKVEAKKEFENAKKLDENRVMPKEDFLNFVEFTVEGNCKICNKTGDDATGCGLRKLLVKYDVEVFDLTVVNKCPYQYCEVGE